MRRNGKPPKGMNDPDQIAHRDFGRPDEKALIDPFHLSLFIHDGLAPKEALVISARETVIDDLSVFPARLVKYPARAPVYEPPRSW